MSKLNSRITDIGNEIFKLGEKNNPGLLDKSYWSGKMMDWAMKNQDFKIEMFRFVDVFPSLKTSEDLSKHLKAYFLNQDIELSPVGKSALGAASGGGLMSKIAGTTIRKNIESMASGFICGRNSKDALSVLEKLWNKGFSNTVDILGEAVVSEKEAEEYFERYKDLIVGLSDKAPQWKSQDLLENTSKSTLPRVNVSIKCSSLYSQLSNLAFRKSVDGIKTRLRKLLSVAVERNVFIYLDMEQNDLREIIFTVAEELFTENEFRDYPNFGIVVQCYLKDSLKDLERLKHLSEERGVSMHIRLVKGAYWDFENILASQRNWETPVFTKKYLSDAQYEKCSRFLIDNHDLLYPAFASHNVRSLAHALAYAESKDLDKKDIEIQMLYGMADSFKHAFISMGYRVREYAPVGELLPGMAYLVRRLLENTSNEGFLKVTFVDEATKSSLLKDPTTIGPENIDDSEVIPKSDFLNEPYVDFSKNIERSNLQDGLGELQSVLPISVHPVVNGEILTDAPSMDVYNPSLKTELVSILHFANTKMVDAAIEASKNSDWRLKANSKKRIKAVLKIADLMRRDKAKLMQLICLESGKPYNESDADVCEAIDFCDYYVAQYRKFNPTQKMGKILGEQNTYAYRARGVTAVIAPWNFPLAILCGQTVAPLVCGNSVLMKPAEESSAIAKYFYEICIEAGVFKDAIHLIPGKGEEVGAYMVAHPDTHIINFTGSKDVGLKILQTASTPQPGQRHIKKVIAEMGGKNALIVDSDADLDEAVAASIYSAFGFSGQKCSALSRIYVVGSAYETFKERFVEAVNSLEVGPAFKVESKLGPVITYEAQQRLLEVIAKNESRVIAQKNAPISVREQGYFVPATVFESDDLESDLAYDEFFGPLVTLFHVPTIEKAVEEVNKVDYALTGGVYSRHPEHIDYVRNNLEVGNLYINRTITGAIVYRQPFGGYKLSGVGAKAGGPDYLLQFLEPCAVSENTMRRGFAPDISV